MRRQWTRAFSFVAVASLLRLYFLIAAIWICGGSVHAVLARVHRTIQTIPQGRKLVDVVVFQHIITTALTLITVNHGSVIDARLQQSCRSPSPLFRRSARWFVPVYTSQTSLSLEPHGRDAYLPSGSHLVCRVSPELLHDSSLQQLRLKSLHVVAYLLQHSSVHNITI